MIDNCSTDGTREYLESLTHINLNVISFPIKELLQLLGIWYSGIYIRLDLLSDADDLWHVDKLLSLSGSISLHPEVDVFCHNEYILKHNRIAGHLCMAHHRQIWLALYSFRVTVFQRQPLLSDHPSLSLISCSSRRPSIRHC